jgi:hypothetical protein
LAAGWKLSNQQSTPPQGQRVQKRVVSGLIIPLCPIEFFGVSIFALLHGQFFVTADVDHDSWMNGWY